MLADELDVVIGVGTHKHTHTAAVTGDRGPRTRHRNGRPEGLSGAHAFGRHHGGDPSGPLRESAASAPV
jgi:hypothetical protein